MVIDTSVFVAIVLGEPEAPDFDDRIRAAETRMVSVATWVELTAVLSARLGMDARPVAARLHADYGLDLVPVDLAQMRIACEAMVRFGKGRHLARLNYGDCFAYALSRSTGEPLLFKGEDFGRTDVAAVI
ncbi:MULTISPECIES: type II toxin-antitoxin system VapC family toxin [Brevundimonas]|jgi:ribonuclease VapC|uniref:Ribonuclease VapC n=1 Tax=Brevundimonas aurantiaca TaxID=74316 RepID=A0A7W9F740_9CAUL|nr:MULTISPECIES: type II toxin-antitoxin system VapC family toxin [Brevundimonas]MBB5738672.1 ribonuclease VapC [Brevundimonas aurantiaca]MCC4294804.1 type II toxin-antitoxin system VapC family toxin [Brevundimonas aurantiaca]MEC7796420.1 type II toxin-antitoxin system VapC family toxin [Pseudomonadota bacterium]